MASDGSEVTLRLARRSDAADLGRLSGQLGFPMTAEVAAAGLRDAPGRPDHALIVAESDGRVAGFAELRRVRLFMVRRQIEVVALVVDEEHRGRGVGTRLLEEAERWAWDLRCFKVRVRSNAERELTHELYRRRGYEATRQETLFEKQLGPARRRTAPFVPRSIATRRDRLLRGRVTGLTIVRVAVGALLVLNGALRAISGGIAGLSESLSASHPLLGDALAWAVTVLEIGGGLALAAGRFVRPLSLLFAAELAAGVLLVEGDDRFFAAGAGGNGAEYSVLIAACLLAVARGTGRRFFAQSG